MLVYQRVSRVSKIGNPKSWGTTRGWRQPGAARGMVRLERKAADSKGPDVPPEGGNRAPSDP